jgi:hypothetical protein
MPVPPIEELCADTADMAHAPGEVPFGRLDEQMAVVGHQAVSSNPDPEHFRGFFELVEEGLIVSSLLKDPLQPPTTVHDVIPGTRVLYGQWSGHNVILCPASSKSRKQI